MTWRSEWLDGRLGSAWPLLLLLLASSAACEEPAAASGASEPLEARAEDFRPEEIPNRRVEGALRTEPFQMREARFLVERMDRRKRLDIWLSDQTFDKCGVPLHRDPRKVWLRFPDVTDLEPGVLRVNPDDDDPFFEIHYEVPTEDGWRGEQGGAALLVIDRVDEDTIRGRLRACFDDGLGSCVEGRFRAEECTGELDVDDSVIGAGHLEDRPLPEVEP